VSEVSCCANHKNGENLMTNDPLPLNIFLIGYRCTGKTSVGKNIAGKIGWEFIDADDLLMKKTGETVSEIVARDGWPAFRKIEKDVLKEICRGRGQVIATGGGVVLDDENIDRMRQSGIVVWLRATPETILKRMHRDTKNTDLRPSLTKHSMETEIKTTLEQRTSLYAIAMTVEVDTENKPLHEVSLEVLTILGRNGWIDYMINE
jgi:shikimate kinase